MKTRITITLSTLLFLFSSAQAAIIYVDIDAAGANNGSSWANAYTDLWTACQNANFADDLWVAEGVYKTDNTFPIDRNRTFLLDDVVDMYGGFDGTETFIDQRDPSANFSILSGAVGLNNISDNAYHVLTVQGSSGYSTLDGFIIQAGNANGAGAAGRGAGITSSFGDLILANCLIQNNNATSGAGMYIAGNADIIIKDSFFQNNSSVDLGGAISTGNIVGLKPNLDITRCQFKDNSADAGGAIYMEGELDVDNSLFYYNSAASAGNAAFIFDGISDFTNCTLAENNGKCFAVQGTLNVLNSIIWGHDSDIAEDGGDAFVESSLLEGPEDFGGSFNLHEEPRFADANGENFSLNWNSNCIEWGTSVLTSTTDLAGNTRIVGGWPDLGAYEFEEGCLAENDLCQFADFLGFINLSQETIEVDFSCSSSSQEEQYSCSSTGRGVWYRIESEYTQVAASVSNFNPSGLDIIISAWQGFACNSLEQIECMDSSGAGGDEEMIIEMPVTDIPAYIFVQSKNGAIGTCNLNLQALDLPCEILGYELGEQTPCENTLYTQEVTVTYINPPQIGSIQVNGKFFAITSSPQTVILTNQAANGEMVDMNIEFAADTSCPYFAANAYQAPCCTNMEDNCANISQPFLFPNIVYGKTIDCSSSGTDVPNSCGSPVGNSIWFRISVPINGETMEFAIRDVTASSPTLDMNLTVFDNCNQGNEIGCLDFSGNLEDEASTISGFESGNHYIRLSGLPGETGSFTFEYGLPGTLTPPSPDCAGDFNNDGFVTSADLLLFLSEFGCSSNCAYDLNDDGLVGSSDLLVFLSVFGNTCD